MTDGYPSISTAYEEYVDGPNPIVSLLRRYLPGRAVIFGVAVISAIAQRLTNLVWPYLLGVTIDVFLVAEPGALSIAFVPPAWIPSTTSGQFHLLTGLFFALVLVTVVVESISFVTWWWYQQSVLHDLRTDAYAATLRPGVPFFEVEQTGDVMSVLNNDVNQLEEFFTGGLRTIIQLTARFAGLLVIMLWLHWQLTLVVLLFGPLMLVVIRAYQRAIEPRYDERRSVVGVLNAHLQDGISGIVTVKAFTNEEYEQTRFEARSRAYWRADWDAAKLSGIFFPARSLVANGALLAILVGGGWWAIFGPPLWFTAPLSAGTFVTFYFYGQMYVHQSRRLADVADSYTDANASAKRVFGLLHYPTTRTDEHGTTTVETIDSRITYDDVTFTYPDADSPALRNVSFEAAPGEFVGLVGPTGAGKSTVLKLLLGFYGLDNGNITVGGVAIDDIPIERLRGKIGYVSQEPFLFDGTVRENIAYDDRDAIDAVEQAARVANAHEFITDLKNGYDTEVGERGVKLSGGQRQRIAIARVVLKDPEILVLDEATSHVDTLTELLVQDSLEEVVAGRTTFAVAHRLSTIRDADQILVFDDGELVEQGTHDKLADAEGLYAALWKIHLGDTGTLPERFAGSAVTTT